MEQNVTPNETKETNEKEKVVEVLKLGMDAHTDFNAVADVAITTTDELGRVINTIFGNAFADYYGCKLDVTFMPNYCAYVLVPKLYFKVLDKSQYNENTITAFIPMSEMATNNMIARVQRVARTAATVGIKIDITDNGKSILEDFVIRNKVNNQVKIEDNFDWTQAYRPTVSNDGTYVEVFKLDIFNILRMIYGDKAPDGSKCYYQVTPNGSIGAVNQYQKATNWNLIIMRLNSGNLNFAAKQLGMYMQIPEFEGMPNINTERL